jgi:hypothetical protein
MPKKFKPLTPPIRARKCDVCGKPVLSGRHIYCKTCARLIRSMEMRRYSPAQIGDIKDYVRENGYICKYTGISLNMEDPHSPWYHEIDHWIPGDGRTVVLTCSLVNTMKSDQSEEEFWHNVKQLYMHKFEHKKFIKRKLAYWYRIEPPRGKYLFKPKKFKPLTPPIKGKKCEVCGKPVLSGRHRYCRRCHRFIVRMWCEGYSPAEIEEIKDYVRENGYVCKYTGTSLDMEDPHSPWYRAIDHWIPRDGRKLVLTCALVNTMKADQLEKEFWYNVKQLYNHKYMHKKFIKKKLACWYRLSPSRSAST